MNDLEDTHCEVRRAVDLQLPTPDPNASFDEDQPIRSGSPGYNHPPHTLGGFVEDTNYSWLSCRSRLTVFNSKTGASISTWTFKSRITCVAQFPSLPGHIPLLLVGLDNDATRLRDSLGMICVFDCTISQVLRAIRLPCGAEQLCIITGGAEWEETDDKRVDILPESSGLACVALRNLDHIIIDLRRTSWENFHDSSTHDESNPAELHLSDPSTNIRHRNRERHAVHNLMSSRIERYLSFNREEFETSVLPQDFLTTALICSRKIGCLISGCLGRVILWQIDGIVRWISPPLDDNVLVSHIALLEPTDDPRPFVYLWMAYQDDTPVSPILRMYAMLFERKYSYKGTNQYFNLEGEPSMKFELELDEGSRIINLCPVIREITQESESGNKNEENLLLISTEGRTLLFDLNQWYKEQMPRTAADCANVDAILATYHSKTEVPSPDNALVSCTHVPLTLKEFPSAGQGSMEDFFFPNSLSLEWIELGTSRIITWITRGVQCQLLREMATSGPVIMIHPAETFHRCVSVGLIPFSGDSSYNSAADTQRDSLLSLCLEQRWTTFLLRCVKEWSDGSAAYLFPAFIRWAVQRASTIKLTAHRLCIPLFDQSGSSVGEAEVKTLRSFSQQMECLSNVVENFSIATSDQEQQQRTLKRITIYLQVLLWFYDVGLLPESQEVDEESLPISISMRIPYPAERLISIYRDKREKYRQEGVKKSVKEEDLFIDELITRDCSELISQWEREATDTISDGKYPPPSLQSLLRSLLTDCYHPETNEMENKHQIIIYLLMDLVMILQGSCPSVDQLVKYPGAFKLSPSLIKLTQALWLLDHEDYHGFLEIMTGQLVCDSDVKDWHHKLVIRTLIRSTQNKLALIYLRVRKPPLSSLEEQGTIITLSVEHGLVQSAFHRRPPSHYSQLLRRFFRACKENGRLNDILHLAMDFDEEETFVQFLEEEKCDETRLLYYLQRSRYNEASNIQPLGPNKRNSSNKSSCLAVFNAYNATLPEVTRKFTSHLSKRNVQVDTDTGSYPRPLSHFKSRSRIREMHEAVIRKAKETFTRGDRLQIPFVTAPSLSLKSSINSNEANCVMFAERHKSYGKRTLDEMREEDESNAGPRKRRRTDEDVSKIEDSRQLSISMVYDTPLVKRKNRLMNSRNTQAETPHSILKIRRMIQDSMSPGECSTKVSPTEEEREKRPRQIRFSLNQPKLEDSLVDGSGDGEGEVEGNKKKSVENSNCGESMESDDFHSPDNSGLSLGQSTVLSDDSNLSIPISGPRRRPSLRKSALNDSNDLLKKSLTRNSILNRGDSSLDSSKLSPDNSISSDIISSTLIHSGTPKVSQARLNPSICGTTVLSGGSSFDFSPGSPMEMKKNGTGVSPCSRDTTESCNDESFSGIQTEEINVSNDSMNNSTSVVEEIVTRTSITTTVILEEFEDNRQVTDVNDNTEHESNFKGHDKSYHSMEIEERIESSEIIHSLTNEVVPSPDPDNLQSQSQDEKHPEAHEEISQSEDPEHLPSDDYDEELLALKYEDDDDDEVFKSLSNSIDVQIEPRPESEMGRVTCETTPKKTVTTRFYEEFNITDDESRSIDESLFIFKKKINEQMIIPEPVISNSMRPESVNITDDESEPEDDMKLPEISRKGSPHESPKIPVNNPPETINEENSIPVRITKLRRGSSVAQEPLLKTPEAPKTPRTRRATSLVQDLPSPNTSGADIPGTPVKRPLRRATSLVKEVLTSSISADKPLGDISELPVRRSSRRKESEASKTPTTPETIEESADESEPIKKLTRGKRGVSVTKDVNVTPRKTRGASVAKQHEESIQITSESMSKPEDDSQEIKTKRTRAGSASKDPEDVTTLPQRRTRAASVTQDTEESKSTRTKRGRTTSVSSEINDVPEKPVRRTRASSVADISKEIAPKRTTRAASVSKEPEEVKITKPKRARTASASSEPAEDDGNTSVRRTRRTSVAKEINESLDEEVLPNKTRRAASVAKESEDVPKKRRAGSVTKATEKDSKDISITRRANRALSVSKDDDEASVEDKIPTRSTRRRGSATKELPSESLRTRRGGSIIKDVIPEENSDESVTETRQTRNSSRVADEGTESATRGRIASIHAIPEEEEVELSGTERGRGRERRAMSVDLPQVELKRTRRKNSSENADEEMEKKSENKGRKVPVRRKRAASETKDLEDVSLIERPRRGRRGSQKEVEEEYQFAAPEEPRVAADGFADQVPHFIFSPPVLRSRDSGILDRREIVNFIPPLTEDEKKMIPVKSRMSRAEDVKQVSRLSHVPGYRTKFVLPKWSQSTSK